MEIKDPLLALCLRQSQEIKRLTEYGVKQCKSSVHMMFKLAEADEEIEELNDHIDILWQVLGFTFGCLVWFIFH